MAKQVQIKTEDIPDDWSQDSADLINKVKLFNLPYLPYPYI
jgi:hypothetical protein